ncbi:MAG: cytochrome b/b6 domain-containing protein [Sulfitobacter sp.]
MALTNTPQRYGGVTKAFHWVTALLILTLLPLGLYANDLPYDTSEELARKAWFFSLHKTLGVTVFFVAVARIIWSFTQPKPGLLNADHKLESFAAEIVHWLLYGALIIVPLSGWIGHAAAAGFAPIWWPFGQGLPLVPKSTGVEHFFGAVHWVTTKVLAVSLLLHIAGALKHHVIDRDATLRRMLPGEAAIGPLPAQHHTHVPLYGAIVVWASAIALAAVLATSASETNGPTPVDLAEVASDWQVQEGVIEITVVQFGSEVAGSFADWTAAIAFDETIPSGKAGSVTATINVASLSLGSVTQQALGADFFAADTYPTAIFMGDIRHAVDGYEAVGTLTIKENSMPLNLPFNLAVDGDSAEMRADLTLDRRDFGIGANMNDEASLAFEVKVHIAFKASRGT